MVKKRISHSNSNHYKLNIDYENQIVIPNKNHLFKGKSIFALKRSDEECVLDWLYGRWQIHSG